MSGFAAADHRDPDPAQDPGIEPAQPVTQNSGAGATWPDPTVTEEVSPARLAALLTAKVSPTPAALTPVTDWQLIDCREDDEFAFNRIVGARHVPLSRWTELAPALAHDQPLVIYCHHGMRSLQATRWLRARGQTNCFSLAGGIEAWSNEIDPAVPRY